MKLTNTYLKFVASVISLAGGASLTEAAIVITEVHPTGSSNVFYSSDWFELTNTDPLVAVDITGWTVDDSSAGTAKIALRGLTSIGPGQSVIFFEGNTTGSTDATKVGAFNTAWGTSFVFGTHIGSYGGSGISLSSTGDAVNIYNGGAVDSVLQARVDFGAATNGTTFDQSAGLNNTTISQLSVVGVNGAYSAGVEIGSPGAIPEPSSFALLGLGALAAFRRKRS